MEIIKWGSLICVRRVQTYCSTRIPTYWTRPPSVLLPISIADVRFAGCDQSQRKFPNWRRKQKNGRSSSIDSELTIKILKQYKKKHKNNRRQTRIRCTYFCEGAGFNRLALVSISHVPPSFAYDNNQEANISVPPPYRPRRFPSP